MKKLLLLFTLLIWSFSYGQTTVHNGAVKVKTVGVYSPSDSIVTINADGLLKYRPASTIGGGGAETDPVYTTEKATLVQTTGNQTIGGDKTFSGEITATLHSLALQNAETSTSKMLGTVEYIRDYVTNNASAVGILTYAGGSAYTTNSTQNGYHIVMTDASGVVTLDDATATVGDQFTIYNRSGGDVTWAFGTGDSAYQGAPANLGDGEYAWATLESANNWSVIVGGTGGAGGGDAVLANTQTFTGLNTFQNNQGITVLHGTGNNGGNGGVINIGMGDGWTTGLSGTASDARFTVGSTSENYIFNENGTTNADDVVTKAYGDANYLGGLANVVDDTTPQLGGELDANSQNINLGSGASNIGYAPTGTTSNRSYTYWYSSGTANRMYDGTTNYAEITNSYIDIIGLTINLVDNLNSTLGNLTLTPSDQLEIHGFSGGVDFDKVQISNAYLDVAEKTATGNISTDDIGTTIFGNSGSAQTYTIPDTLTEGAGAHITFIQEGAGAVTIAVSGTATINGGASSITLSGQYKAVQLIQRVASSDDWIAIGSY
jgi:hypothetical protein